MDFEEAKHEFIFTARKHGVAQALLHLERLGCPLDLREKVLDDYQLQRQGIRNIPMGGGDFAVVAGPNAPLNNNDFDIAFVSSPNDRYWGAYKRSLVDRCLSDELIDSVNEMGDRILSLIPHPRRDEIHGRGLVVGQVQSGKTTSYAGVISKAADYGYKMVFVLTGMHNALRRQTQQRLERDLRVRDRNSEWNVMTTEEDDFRITQNHQPAIFTAQHPAIWIVKKNSTVLRRIVQWLNGANQYLRNNIAALIIDDEADQASINTAANPERGTVIHNEIVQLLEKSLPRSTYIAYTATPYANMLIDPTPQAERLYPRDFIICLPTPAGYWGAERIFGRTPIDEDDQGTTGLDVLRSIPDTEASKMRAGPMNSLPATLEDALSWFLLATAARRIRTSTEPPQPSTMLIHASVRQDRHRVIKKAIQGWVDGLRRNMHASKDCFRNIWLTECDRVPIEEGTTQPEFDSIWNRMVLDLTSLYCIEDHANSPERLDYERHNQVVVVGGNTLSRGLTLEGLVCSHFVRTSNAYDTLMQMGRWFGFRKGYGDLVRIWVPDNLRGFFRDLATVEHELREDIQAYSIRGDTPMDTAMRIRTHPNMAVTAPSKRRAAVPVLISYEGHRVQTINFHARDEDWLKGNREAANELIKGRKWQRMEGRGDWISRGLAGGELIEFLDSYQFHESGRRVDRSSIVEYLNRQAESSGGTWDWNIVVKSLRKDKYGQLNMNLPSAVNMISRGRLQESTPENASIGALMGSADIVADIKDVAGVKMDRPAELMAFRRTRLPRTGLLLIYPIAPNAKPVEGRMYLDAVAPVIGMAMVFPGSQGTSSLYLTVRLQVDRRGNAQFHDDDEDGDPPTEE